MNYCRAFLENIYNVSTQKQLDEKQNSIAVNKTTLETQVFRKTEHL